MRGREEEWVSTHTGETLSFRVERHQYPKGCTFVVVFQQVLAEIAASNALRGTELRVLLKLLSVLDYENWVSISQQTIAEDLSIRQSQVSSAFRALSNMGMIDVEDDPSDRRRHRYRLSETLCWKGDAKAWARRRAQRNAGNVIRLPERPTSS